MCARTARSPCGVPVHRAGTKEFVLEAPPEPRTKFVEVDPGASQMLMNFMIGSGFMCKRVGYLYGKWVEDAEGQLGVQARAVPIP